MDPTPLGKIHYNSYSAFQYHINFIQLCKNPLKFLTYSIELLVGSSIRVMSTELSFSRSCKICSGEEILEQNEKEEIKVLPPIDDVQLTTENKVNCISDSKSKPYNRPISLSYFSFMMPRIFQHFYDYGLF